LLTNRQKSEGYLNLPIFLQAIKALNYAHPIVIDTAKINDKIFLGVAGIGFDAHIAHHFAQFGKRRFIFLLSSSFERVSKIPGSILPNDN
jgi:diacylglycerol kinase family enzyme